MFSINSKMYEETDGASMGGTLGPVLANIIMTECEKFIVNQLKENDIVKFYEKCVDDSLLVMKKILILNKFNSISKIVQLPPILLKIVCFSFLTMKFICKLSRHISQKHPNGQYTNIKSFTL